MSPRRHYARIPLPRPRRAELESLSDVALAARARDGDPAAVDVLVTRHESRVRRLAHSLIPDPDDAQDAAQEALARVVDRIHSYRGEAAFTTWLHRLTVNVCTDAARRLGRRLRSETPTGDDDVLEGAERTSRSVHDLAVARTVAPALRRAIAALPDRQRTVVVLKDVLSLSYEEIAERLELPVGTVKSHAHRGRRLVAERLGKRAS
jgi:RNA polymerase sigma-70 factor (ECF subfamily)